MINFITGAIIAIAVYILYMYIEFKIDDRKIRKKIGEDYVNAYIPESILNGKRNVTICFHDNEYTAIHFNKDKNIEAFTTFHPNNIKSADFYYSLYNHKELITIDYKLQLYKAVITQIKVIDEDTLRIYYTVMNKYLNN